jgi:hypothetical protein
MRFALSPPTMSPCGTKPTSRIIRPMSALARKVDDTLLHYAAALIGSMSVASSLSALELFARLETAQRCK